jgi:hypothetical protein
MLLLEAAALEDPRVGPAGPSVQGSYPVIAARRSGVAGGLGFAWRGCL